MLTLIIMSCMSILYIPILVITIVCWFKKNQRQDKESGMSKLLNSNGKQWCRDYNEALRKLS